MPKTNAQDQQPIDLKWKTYQVHRTIDLWLRPCSAHATREEALQTARGYTGLFVLCEGSKPIVTIDARRWPTVIKPYNSDDLRS